MANTMSTAAARAISAQFVTRRRMLFTDIKHAHIGIGDVWIAAHCHCPLGIFTQVWAQRSCTSNDFPDGSVPSPEKFPVATTVSPNAVSFMSVSRTLFHLISLQVARTSNLLVTFGALPVITALSAIRGPSKSGLQLCCASNHCCSSLTTVSSVVR